MPGRAAARRAASARATIRPMRLSSFRSRGDSIDMSFRRALEALLEVRVAFEQLVVLLAERGEVAPLLRLAPERLAQLVDALDHLLAVGEFGNERNHLRALEHLGLAGTVAVRTRIQDGERVGRLRLERRH